MAFLRPNDDAIDGNWLNESGNNTNLYASLNETTAVDTSYIESPVNPVAEVCKIALSNPTGTLTEPFILRYRYNNIGATSLRVRLLQGTTEIAFWVETDSGWQTKERTLSSLQFAAITDFTDLYVELRADPTVDPTLVLDLDFVAMEGTGLDSRLTFTRASTATYTNSSGVIASVASGAPRFQYDPATLEARGLLLEEQRTNYVLQSANLAASPWGQNVSGSGSVSKTANAAVAPDGTTTACLVSVNRSASSDTALCNQAGMGPISAYPNVASIWLKAKAAGDVGKQLSFGIASTSVWVTPTVVTLTANWKRYSVNDSAGAINVDQFGIGHLSTAVSGAAAQTGLVEFYAWGAQVEAGTGNTTATTDIPTTTVAITRSAEVVGLPSASWLTQVGTYFLEGQGAPEKHVRFLTVNANNENFIIRLDPDFIIAAQTVTYGLPQVTIPSSWTTDPKYKIGLATENKDSGPTVHEMDFTANGVSPTLAGGFNMSWAFTTLWIGCHLGGSNQPNGTFKRLQYYNVRKTPTELVTLTTL